MRLSASPAKSKERGIALIEALIAILVIAIGILGVLGVQMRTLSDTQTGVRRAQAIRLIEDFSDRLKANPNAMHNIDKYTTSWNDKPAISKNCTTNACDNSELAQFELSQWKTSVNQLLPGGRAAIFVSEVKPSPDNRRELGVMISWRKNEKTNDADYLQEINAASNGSVACEQGRTCHLQFIPLSGRCAPYRAGINEVKFFCANGN